MDVDITNGETFLTLQQLEFIRINTGREETIANLRRNTFVSKKMSKLCDFDLKTIETDETYTADEYDDYMAQN